MGSERQAEKVRVVCKECTFSKEVTSEGDESAEVIRKHGQETGHQLTTEELDDDK